MDKEKRVKATENIALFLAWVHNKKGEKWRWCIIKQVWTRDL